MDLATVKQIEELVTHDGTEQINAYLNVGWVVLAVATMATDHTESSQPIIKYSLGWSGDLPAPRPTSPNRHKML